MHSDRVHFIQRVSAFCNRSHLDVAAWKLISELQARSKRIHEAPMRGFHSPIDLKHVGFVQRMVWHNVGFHETPHQWPKVLNGASDLRRFPRLQIPR